MHREQTREVAAGQYQRDPNVEAGAKGRERRQQHPVLVEDVGLERLRGQLFPVGNEAGEPAEVAHHDDRAASGGCRIPWLMQCRRKSGHGTLCQTLAPMRY